MTRDLDRAYAHCEQIVRSHYENFTVGSRLLPRAERRHLAALYAFARGADDLADEPDIEGDRLHALDDWEAELDAALAGRSAGPVFRAVAHTLEVRGLTDDPLRALLRAFRYDAAFEPFSDFEALRQYCRDSANPVGRLVLGLFGVRDPVSIALSDDVCTGLQLANFWQDLSVDLLRGRSYVPVADIALYEGAGLGLADRRGTPGFEALLALQLERARYFLGAGDELARRLSARASVEVRIFAGGGLRIIDRVEALGSRILRERPILGHGDFVQLLVSSVGLTGWSRLRPGPSDSRGDVGPQRARPKGVV